MATLDLVRYLSDSAEELLGKAEAAGPEVAKTMMDEAEELMVLGASIMDRRSATIIETKEAA